MRLTLVIHSLQGGGAERVMTTLANAWAAASWQVTLLTFDDGAVPPFYELDARVNYMPLNIARLSTNKFAAIGENLHRLYRLRQAIRASRPDAVLSFLDRTNVLTALATTGLRTRVVVSERSDPLMNDPGSVWSRLRKLVYPLADVVVVQSKGALNYFSPRVQSHARIIPNPVLPVATNPGAALALHCRPLILAMGRMVSAKGFDLLLRAFAQIKEAHPDWMLAILGDGPLFGEIEQLRNALGLADRVLLPGRVKQTQAYLSDADLFVMSSRYEGFPNALCEAMASGVAVISTDCPSGPREIIRDGIDGLLIAPEDAASLAAAMDQLMRNQLERKRLALRAAEITVRFALPRVVRMWEEVLCADASALDNSRATRLDASQPQHVEPGRADYPVRRTARR
jgi:GalNAc-alpha-(1->4)-GalNAc-alpha-(1->3)-diNAcBac-PP-undecaprenol alpha-1,4-N-acetyl-D-galactosaminyltransferase